MREAAPRRGHFAFSRVLGRLSLVTVVFLFLDASSSAHIVMGTKSLHLRVAEADLIVRARVTDPAALFVSADPLTRRRLIEIEVLEVLKGRTQAKKLRFAQGGHDVPRYQGGQQALFFLEGIETSRELRALAVPGGPTHVSGQEHHERFTIEAPDRSVLLSATRNLVASGSAPTADERVALLRRATLDLLTSGDAALAAMALANLVLTPNAALLTPADVPRLELLLANPTVSIGVRAGLISQLERRGLVESSPLWLALLEDAGPQELPAAIRAAGVHPSERVTGFLLARLADPHSKVEISAECAIALGRSRGAATIEVVEALADALSRGAPRLRNAAIRGLGQIEGKEARDALAQAAKTHPDATTRRRARAAAQSGRVRSLRSPPS